MRHCTLALQAPLALDLLYQGLEPSLSWLRGFCWWEGLSLGQSLELLSGRICLIPRWWQGDYFLIPLTEDRGMLSPVRLVASILHPLLGSDEDGNVCGGGGAELP